jgi:hypothetical protein
LPDYSHPFLPFLFFQGLGFSVKQKLAREVLYPEKFTFPAKNLFLGVKVAETAPKNLADI